MTAAKNFARNNIIESLEKKSEFAQRRAALRRKLKGASGRSEGLRGTARTRDADAGRRVPRVARGRTLCGSESRSYIQYIQGVSCVFGSFCA